MGESMEAKPSNPDPRHKTGREPRKIDVERLLDGASEVRLLYQQEEYRLRLTRNRKLILTK